jgi:hypothetical protein
MKKLQNQVFAFALAALFLVGSSVPAIGQATPQGHSPSTDLHAYVQVIQGEWLYTPRSYDTNSRALSLQIYPDMIEGDILKIRVEEYCHPNLVQHLHFRLHDQRLRFVGASLEDCVFDMQRIDFIDIWYEEHNGKIALFYEAMEMEHQNYQKVKLQRTQMPNPF